MLRNSIKYNPNGSENNALNKDNWWIGTGDVNKHPTSSTGFYRTITPNGYAIYSPKPNGEPSIHILNTDTELINFTNRFYNNNFTTVEECLEYYANEPDLLCQTSDFDSIITNSLIIFYDVSQPSSYPKTGNIIYDLSGNQNNMEIKNNPSFQQYYFRFDPNNNQKGTIQSSNELDFGGGSITVCAWVRERNNAFGSTYWNVVSKYKQFILGPNGDGVMAFLPYLANGGWLPSNYSNASAWNNVYGQSNFDHTKFHYYVGVYNKNNGKIQLYIDATLVAEHNENTSGLSADTGVIKIAKRDSSGNYFDGDIGGVHIYNRALSEEEIKQNYNATKYKELVYDFRNGEFDNDWVISNFYILSDTSYSGSYSAGSDNQGTVNADLKPKDLVGGKNVYSIEYYWWERGSQTGHVVDFVDNNGNLVLRSGTENPQWHVTDAAGKDQIYGGDNYNAWTYYCFTFNWNDGTYDYYMKDTLSGTVKTGNRTLNNNTNIEKIHIDGSPYGTGDECRFDNIRIKLNKSN